MNNELEARVYDVDINDKIKPKNKQESKKIDDRKKPLKQSDINK